MPGGHLPIHTEEGGASWVEGNIAVARFDCGVVGGKVVEKLG